MNTEQMNEAQAVEAQAVEATKKRGKPFAWDESSRMAKAQKGFKPKGGKPWLVQVTIDLDGVAEADLMALAAETLWPKVAAVLAKSERLEGVEETALSDGGNMLYHVHAKDALAALAARERRATVGIPAEAAQAVLKLLEQARQGDASALALLTALGIPKPTA